MIFSPVRLSPVEYVNEIGILKKINEIVSKKNYTNPIIFTDNTVIEKCSDFLPENLFLKNKTILFHGNCTYEETRRLIGIFKNPDVIVALGGGQLLDTAKNIADIKKVDLINIPTLPSNCAAVTTKSVMYSENDHKMIGRERHTRPINLVLVDPLLLRNAPLNFFLSGIGDTLAKWYEIRKRLNGQETDSILELAEKSIELCKEKMLAINNLETINIKIFGDLLDVIFLIAASVDGFAREKGKSVVAHSFYNNYLNVVKKSTKTHGELVAFGILVQLKIENDFIELNKLIKFYGEIGLPVNLKSINLSSNSKEVLKIAENIADPKNGRIHSVFPNLTKEKVYSAINSLGGDFNAVSSL